MRIAICDDEAYMRKEIAHVVRQSAHFLGDVDVEEFTSGEQLVQWYNIPNKADVLLMDIEMGKTNGIQAAKRIRKVDRDLIVVFITSHSESILETFDCETFNFLTKPLSHIKLQAVLKKADDKMKSENAFFTITWKTEVARVPVRDIKYVERSGRHLIIHTINRDFDMVGTLSKTLSELEDFGFLQVHQGFIVNMNMIYRFDSQDVILHDGTKVMVSVRRRSESVEKYLTYIQLVR